MLNLCYRLFIAAAFVLVSFAVVAEPVNINTASADQIAAALTGIGPKKADDIVKYREQNGPFESIDDLLEIKGIGKKTLESNRTNIVVGDVSMDDPREEAISEDASTQ